MIKAQTATVFHPFMKKRKGVKSNYYEIEHPALHTDLESKVTFCDKIKDFISFAGLDEASVVDYMEKVIRKQLPCADRVFKLGEMQGKAPEVQFIDGIMAGMYERASGLDTISPLFVCGYFLGRNTENFFSDKPIAWRFGIIRITITDARVLYVIDKDENLFDAFGYLCGGEDVFRALITPERAKRIPIIEDFADVFVWCVKEKLIDISKLDGSKLSLDIQARLLAEDIAVNNPDKELVKTLGVDERGESSIQWMLSAPSVTSDEVMQLNSAEIAYLIKSNAAIVQCVPTPVLNEGLMLMIRMGYDDNVQQLYKYIPADKVHLCVACGRVLSKLATNICDEDKLIEFCKINRGSIIDHGMLDISSKLTNIKKLKEVRDIIYPAQLSSPIHYIHVILNRFK